MPAQGSAGVWLSRRKGGAGLCGASHHFAREGRVLCAQAISDALQPQKALGWGEPIPDHPPACTFPSWTTERNCKNDF